MAALRIGRFVFFAILFVLLTFASASAFEVYNHTKKKLKVYGESCAGCFEVEIKAKGHKACPGDSHGCGSRYISILASSYLGKTELIKMDDGSLVAKVASWPARFLVNDVIGECQSDSIWKDIKNTLTLNRHFYFYFGKKVPAHGWASVFDGKKKIKDENGKSQEVKWPRGFVKNKHGKKIWEGLLKKHCGPR